MVPFIIYTDCESYLETVDTCKPSGSSTMTTQMHTPCRYSYKVVCTEDPSLSRPIEVYTGPRVIENLLEALMGEKDYIHNILRHVEPMVMTPEDKRRHDEATHCDIYEKPLGDDKVADHSHLIKGDLEQNKGKDISIRVKVVETLSR